MENDRVWSEKGNRFQGLGGIPPPKALGVTPKKFQNAALFLQLGLPSVLIHHENGAFRNFSVDGSHFENGAFRKR